MSYHRCASAGPGATSLIPARSHTFMEIDHEIIPTIILLPFADSFKKGCVSYKQKYVHELLVNHLFKPVQEKVWLGELPHDHSCLLGRKATKQDVVKYKNQFSFKQECIPLTIREKKGCSKIRSRYVRSVLS